MERANGSVGETARGRRGETAMARPTTGRAKNSARRELNFYLKRIRAGFEPFRGLSHPLALANQVEGSEWRIGVGALRRGSKPARTCLVR
jgi:hypothetical protein